MKFKKMKTIPAKQVEVLDYVVCDICKEVIQKDKYDRFAVDDIEISRNFGDSYPDGGGSTVKESFDICGICFSDKLKPWFASFGATPEKTEIGW